jgi:hypothetical protein
LAGCSRNPLPYYQHQIDCDDVGFTAHIVRVDDHWFLHQLHLLRLKPEPEQEIELRVCNGTDERVRFSAEAPWYLCDRVAGHSLKPHAGMLFNHMRNYSREQPHVEIGVELDGQCRVIAAE